MRRSTPASIAQVLARLWFLAAATSLLLPASTRLGWWLPLHLALAGAASTAIAGAAPDFAAALSAGRRPGWVWVPIPLVALGALAIAFGVPSSIHRLVAIGGALFALGALAIAAAVRASWRSGINRRHAAIARLYVFAALCPVLGAPLGALLGTGVLGGNAYLDVRRAHVALNLLGFLGLTIVATSVLLVPTVLRVKSPAWRPAGPFVALAAGVVVAAVGAAIGVRTIAALGAAGYTLGAVEVVAMAVLALRRRPEHAEVAAASHLIAALTWLALGSAAWTAMTAAGTSDRYLLAVVAAIALGTVIQALLGAWSHLVPMAATGGPEAHRRRLARADLLVAPQVAAFNLAVAVVVGAAAGGLPDAWASLGVAVAAVCAAGGVVKLSLP